MKEMKRSVVILFLLMIVVSSVSATTIETEFDSDSLLTENRNAFSASPAAFMTNNIPFSENHTNSLIQRSVVSGALFATGLLYRDNNLNERIVNGMQKPISSTSDYVQYGPALLMFGLKVCGLESRSDWGRMIVTDAMSVGIMAAIVYGTKYMISRERPDGTSFNSFPSGHTATAFVAATLLHKEYGETVSPWFSVAGYGMATVTGLMRIETNRHWVSDVLAGAGAGMFSSEFAYSLSDLLFKERYLGRPLKNRGEYSDCKWSFSLATDYFITTKYANDGYGHVDMKPACTAGIVATYMPDRIGATVYAGFTRLKWTGNDYIFLPDYTTLPNIQNFGAGITARMPLTDIFTVDSQLLLGGSCGNEYSFTTVQGDPLEWTIPDGIRLKGTVALSMRASPYSELSVLFGADAYSRMWTSFIIGTRYSLTF